MLVLMTDGICTDTSLPILQHDSLLEGANGGVPWLFDLASTYGYPAQANPANGQLVQNMNASGNNASVILQAGNTVNYLGHGFDFTGVTEIGNYVSGPVAAPASIWGSANQYFIVCLYWKLPTSGNWNTAAAIHEIFKFAVTTYLSGAELVLMAEQDDGAITFRRQTAAATVTTLDVMPNALDYGSFAQIAFWRTASGQFARIKSANGTVTQSTTSGSNNTQNFSSLIPQVGVARGFKGAADGATMSAAQQNAAKYRVYRGWIENSVVSGRDPLTVLDQDYTRTVNRGVYS